MYEVDNKDKIIELTDLPQSSVGAPCPMVLAGEHDVLLSFYLQNTPSDWDGTWVRVVGTSTVGEPVAIVKFSHCYAHMFGPPNDEAFGGHPLAARGLHPCGMFKIENSSWIRKLEEMNSVHPYHDKERFLNRLNHYIFSFHDVTFECIADNFDFNTDTGSIENMVPKMLKQIR